MRGKLIKEKFFILFFFFFFIFFYGKGYGRQNSEKKLPNHGYAPVNSCEKCHSVKWKSFVLSPHGISANSKTPAARHGCQSCHGPSLVHVLTRGKYYDKTMILFSKSTPPEKINKVCLKCHSGGKVALWEGSVHQTHDLACTNCHNVHKVSSSFMNPYLLAKSSIPSTCFQCHKNIRIDFLKFSHHPLRTGKSGTGLVCTQCHNPHGTFTSHLITANSINQLCWKCHPAKRGPFLWEHPPEEEDCLNCHVPHGSSHRNLLVMEEPFLCQRCHDEIGPHHDTKVFFLNTSQAGETPYQGLPVFGLYHGCTNCHREIHGSNSPSGITFLR
ncbi:MAG: DmsE family decaheme c-type cytochrome [Firmicutes bacterium]|nr:DmsE family decaheme c-type cytochrome [Bacillota bacterium]